MPLDLSMTKLLILGVLAMLIFGPEKLPQLARDAGRMVRQFRGMAQQARSELRSELGDVVPDFDVRDLNPRTFVRKHLFDDDMPSASVLGEMRSAAAEASAPMMAASAGPGLALADGERAPFDPDAT
jgi:sec-independent protein translocase protein TatB